MNSQIRNISASRNGERVDAVKMVDSNPSTVTAISKMVSGLHSPQHDEKGRRKIQAPDYFHMSGIAGDMTRGIVDNENLLQMLPDLELAAQILVSSILSPKDMMEAKLNYIAADGMMSSAANSAIITIIQTYFTQVYNISNMLPKMLRNVLFTSGSYPIAVIPESSLDHFINKDIVPDLQSFNFVTNSIFERDGKVKNLGILGSDKSDKNQTLGASLEQYFKPDEVVGEIKVSFAFEEYDNVKIVPEGQETTKLQAEQVDPYLTFIDNPEILKIPGLTNKLAEYEAARRLKIRGMPKVAQESFIKTDKSGLSDQELYTLIARAPGGRTRQVNSLSPQENLQRTTVGAPLIMQLPPESVIPVYAPGQPDTHVGYYVIIDETGNPVSRNSNPHYKDHLAQQFSMPGNAQHRLIQQAHAAMVGMNCTSTNYIDYATRIYGDMIEAEMIARLKNGLYKTNVSVARNDEMYRLMMSRMMRSQNTQLLFIPKQMLTYFALDYNDNGTGRSIMDDLKTINALRAIMTIASVYGSVRNSIGRTAVEIQLDPDDPDPEKSREKAMTAFASSRSSLLPIHLNRPLDIVSTLQQAGVEFASVGSEKLPDMKVSVSETQSNVQKPDAELDENLRRMSFMRFGLSPETVDNGFAGDFATSVVANNILLSRRVKQTQDGIVPLVSTLIRMIIRGTESLYSEILETVQSNYESIQLDDKVKEMLTTDDADVTKTRIVEYVTETFINELQCELPSPDTTTAENQLAAFQSWKELFDEILDAYITPDLFNEDLDGDTLTNNLERLKAIVRNYHIRKWCVENGVLSELTSITAKDSNGEPVVDLVGEHQNYVKEIAELFGKIIKSTENLGQNLDKIAASATPTGEVPEGDTSSSTDTSSTSSTDDQDEGLGGLGDLEGLDDLPPLS